MIFALLILAGFAGMEVASYVLHRWLFHGLLWRIHRTHHEKTHGPFELNDLFSLGFGALATWFIVRGAVGDPSASVTLPLGIGITIYGALYFVIHDVYTHKRFASLQSENWVLRMIQRAHQRHHQTVDQPGQEPYGLFLFDYELFRKRSSRRRDI